MISAAMSAGFGSPSSGTIVFIGASPGLMLKLENSVHQLLVGQLGHIPSAKRARVPQPRRGFPPPRARLEPEDLRRDVAAAGRVEQETCHLGVRFRLPEIKLVAI